MVQLPATAAIEYVAACCRTRTKIETITKTVRGLYARSPQDHCVYEPSRLSVPSIVAWRTNKKTKRQKKRQTRPRSSAGSWPPLPKFSGYVEVGAHYIFHPSIIWVRPLFTELGPKNPHFSGDIINEHTGQLLVRPNALWLTQPSLGGPWPTWLTLQHPHDGFDLHCSKVSRWNSACTDAEYLRHS